MRVWEKSTVPAEMSTKFPNRAPRKNTFPDASPLICLSEGRNTVEGYMKYLDIKIKGRSHLGVIKSLLQNAHGHVLIRCTDQGIGGNLLEM